MDYNKLVKHYGGAQAAADALGFTRQALYHWRDFGIPTRTQMLIATLSRGRLKADKAP